MNFFRVFLSILWIVVVSYFPHPALCEENDFEALSKNSVKIGFQSGWDDTIWEPVTFPGKSPTTYNFQPSEESVCSNSKSSASGFARTINFDIQKYPLLEWDWKVLNPVRTSGKFSKETDDYSARVYINFEEGESFSYWERLKLQAMESYYGREFPVRSINFVWGDQLKKGSIRKSPYTDRVILKALRSSNAPQGKWLKEVVNLRDIFIEAFGGNTIPKIDSIAIMTDTDNTNSEARACYRNLVAKRAGMNDFKD